MNLTKEEKQFHNELADIVKDLSEVYREKDITISWTMLLDEAKTIHRRRTQMNKEAEEFMDNVESKIDETYNSLPF